MMARLITGHWGKIISSILLLIAGNCHGQITGIRGFYRQNAKLTADTTTVIRPQAQRFIDSAGITDATQKKAINRLVMDLNGEINPNYSTVNVWSKFKAVYPFVGGSASTHKWNLVNPVNADTAFRLTFPNGATHSATGVDWNGTTQYAETFLNASTSLTLNNTHLSYYSRQDEGSGTDIGCYTNADAGSDFDHLNIQMAIKLSGNLYSDSYDAFNGRISIATTNASGFYMQSRINTISYNVYRNGTSLASVSITNTGQLPNGTINIGRANSIPSLPNPVFFYSSRECAFASIGQGLTNLEQLAFYNAVQYYEYTLNRQVN